MSIFDPAIFDEDLFDCVAVADSADILIYGQYGLKVILSNYQLKTIAGEYCLEQIPGFWRAAA